jgi:hypothetical protein
MLDHLRAMMAARIATMDERGARSPEFNLVV